MKNLVTLFITKLITALFLASPVAFAQTTCPTPITLGTANITTTSAQLSWALPGPVGASYYHVQYRPSGTLNWIQVTVQLQTYTLNSLICATAYEWRVRSVCANTGSNTTSPFSTTAIFTTLPCTSTCPAPTGLTTSSVGVNSAVVSWVLSPGSLSYNLRYRNVAALNWITISNATSPYQLGTLGCNAGYEWQVQAVCTSGTGNTTVSPWSASATFNTLACPGSCPAPTGLTSTNITSNSATVSWNAIAGAGNYTVRYRPSGTVAWIYTNSASPTKNLVNLYCNTVYQWQVRANCAVTSNSQINPFSATATFTTLSCPATCNAPTGLTVTNTTSTSATLSWNSVAGAIGYNVQYAVAGTVNYVLVNVTGTSTSISGLLPATAYVWQVQTICGSTPGPVLSPWSALNTFFTQPAANTCATPTGLTATVVGNQGVYLVWSTVTGALSYNIRYRVASSTAWTNTTSPTNSKQVGGLTPGAVYEFQVQTVCSSLNGAIITSAWSPSILVTLPLLMTVYPNPADHVVTLSFDTETSGVTVVEIQNLFGVIVYTQTLQSVTGKNDVTISTAFMKEGLYNLNVQTGSKQQTARLVIQR